MCVNDEARRKRILLTHNVNETKEQLTPSWISLREPKIFKKGKYSFVFACWTHEWEKEYWEQWAYLFYMAVSLVFRLETEGKDCMHLFMCDESHKVKDTLYLTAFDFFRQTSSPCAASWFPKSQQRKHQHQHFVHSRDFSENRIWITKHQLSRASPVNELVHIKQLPSSWMLKSKGFNWVERCHSSTAQRSSRHYFRVTSVKRSKKKSWNSWRNGPKVSLLICLAFYWAPCSGSEML